MKNFSYLTVDIWCLLPKVGELRTKPPCIEQPFQGCTVELRSKIFTAYKIKSDTGSTGDLCDM